MTEPPSPSRRGFFALVVCNPAKHVHFAAMASNKEPDAVI